MKNLESTYEEVQSRKVAEGFQSATLLKRLHHRYEAKISEAHSQKSCSYSNNWITQLIESI